MKFLEETKIPEKKEKGKNKYSLKFELENLEEIDNFEEPPPESAEIQARRTLSSNFLRNSFRAVPRTLGVFSWQGAKIEPKKSRKSPGEEYFTLLTQAIKLDSPYMDVICVVSPGSLYQTALKNDIPFHKWHSWVEKQLNSLYLQTIYQKNSNKSVKL